MTPDPVALAIAWIILVLGALVVGGGIGWVLYAYTHPYRSDK